MSVASRLLSELYESGLLAMHGFDPADDPDDELLPETPLDVIHTLGFDPLEGEKFDEAHVPLLDRTKIPAHIQTALTNSRQRIPPAWHDVTVEEDPTQVNDVNPFASGRDTKERKNHLYTKEHWQRVSAEKFERVKHLMDAFDYIQSKNEEAKRDPSRAEAAHALDLVMKTGLRVGGENDTKAEKQAFGATTLQGRHVRVSPTGNVALHFVGKKGVQIHLPIDDPTLAQELRRRKRRAGSTGKIYNTTDAEVRTHLNSMMPGYHPKDFRTAHAARIARRLIRGIANPPRNASQYKKAVRTVADGVAEKLGNSRAVCLQSYIPPEVFGSWKTTAGVE